MRERMGLVDGSWLRMDRADNTADVVSLLTFERLPERSRIRRLVQERLLACPRFRQRAVRDSTFTGDVWEDDPAFSIDHHLVETSLESGTPEALREFVSGVATAPLDPARPLWRAHLVTAPGAGILVTKMHHCLADGFALVGLLLSLADDPPADPVHPHALAAYRRIEPWLEPGLLLRDVLRSPSRAVRVGVEVGAMALSLARMASLPPDPHQRMTPRLNGIRLVAWSHGMPLDRVRDAARLHGATINDVVLAAVAGAVRGHLERTGETSEAPGLRALVPVNLRPGLPDPHGPLGNRFGLVYLDLPTDLASPHARLEAVRERTRVLKARPDPVVSFGVLKAMGAVPAAVPWASTWFAQKASIVVTNVPGPREPLHLAGERVVNAMFWVPHPATLGLGVSVLTYAGQVQIGVRGDSAVLADPLTFVEQFERELDVIGGAAPHRRAS